MKKRGDLVLALVLLVALAGSWLYITQLSRDNLTAVVSQDGKVIREINLTAVEEPFQFRVDDGQGGFNIIEVERGRIRVLEANCPEQVDVRQGWISAPHESLVCLPHRLVVSIRSSKDKSPVDGIVR